MPFGVFAEGPCWQRPNHSRHAGRYAGDRSFGCSGRTLAAAILDEETASLQPLLGLPKGPAGENASAIMDVAAGSRRRDEAVMALAHEGYSEGDIEQATGAAAIVAGHPDAALSVHPATEKAWMAAEIDLSDWLSTRPGAGVFG